MLEIRNLCAWYGQTQALFGVDFSVERGCTVALVGPNGAGKSTIVRSILGLIRTEGSIELDGVALDSIPAHVRARDYGVAVVHEGRGLFPRMSVRENLVVGLRDGRKVDLSAVFDLFPVLANRQETKASNLSGGEQQMLAIGRAVLREPRLLVLDEPSLGLAPVIVDEIYSYLTAVQGAGITTLLVEQSIPRAQSASDFLCFVRVGRTEDMIASSDEDAAKTLAGRVFGEFSVAPGDSYGKGPSK